MGLGHIYNRGNTKENLFVFRLKDKGKESRVLAGKSMSVI